LPTDYGYSVMLCYSNQPEPRSNELWSLY